MSLPDHVRENKASWEVEAANYVENAKRNWATAEISWGMFGVPESHVGALPDVGGIDVVELGCGTAYFSAWLARRGARPTGVDITENQLATARAMQAEHGLEFPLIQASAEDVPLPDACADLVLSEYGASLWCEPDAWVSEAARLLRPGGRLVFLTSSVLVALTAPPSGPERRPARAPAARDLAAALRGRGRRRVPPRARRLDSDARAPRLRRHRTARAVRA
jgi:SAM-dependent methyltransferase